MLPQSQAKIFLAAERGYTETEGFRSYNTFNFGNYQNQHKVPFGSLYVLNDDTLAGGRSFQLLVEEDSDIIILPVVGAITYKDSTGNAALIEAGQAQRFATPKNTILEIDNPHGHDLVNFLQLWIQHPFSGPKQA